MMSKVLKRFPDVLVAAIACSVGLGAALVAGPCHAGERQVPAPADATPRQALNRLATEASPYLRQHASNPVDWYPWGAEAFEKARRDGKPIFLSVGYSTCHWCHVMARESFSDPTIASELRKGFISIKLDRERHPDIDQIYQTATEIITRQGGWPNSVFLTPDLKPFFATIYQPPSEFRETIERAGELWRTRRNVLEAEAERLSRLIAGASTARLGARPMPADAIAHVVDRIVDEIDPFNGGLGVAPKFPREPVLLLLLQRAERHRDEKAIDAVKLTLDNILDGGIADQIAGGFHRYAVDEAWRVPHFEKMLYTQALMAQVLVRAWRASGSVRYARALRSTLDFVLSDMSIPEGAFASAIDAETEGKEGLYYLWTIDEIRAALGEDAEFAIKAFGMTSAGGLEGRNVLHLPEPIVEQAAAERVEPAAFTARLDRVRARLLTARRARPAPQLDRKVLTAWNGLMIRAFAEAAALLDEPRYVDAAERAATFLYERMLRPNGDLRRVWFEGHADLAGAVTDYALAGLGFLALYDVTGAVAWRDRAAALALRLTQLFEDGEAGDYFSTETAETFVRSKPREDNELPSGNAATLELFQLLAQRDSSPEWRQRTRKLAAALSVSALETAPSNAYGLRVLDIVDHGEAGHLQHAGRGHVRARLSREAAGLAIVLDIAPGWHVNASQPLDDFLIPTRVTVDGIPPERIRYPAPVRRRLGFNASELALYEGRVEITVDLPPGREPRRVLLALQTCSDRVCLDPESIILTERPRPLP